MQVVGYMCGPVLYEYEGWCFENGTYTMPWPMKKSGEPYMRLPTKVKVILDEFYALTDEERNVCYVGGGCEPLVIKEARE